MTNRQFFTSDEHLKHKAMLLHCPDRKVQFGNVDNWTNAYIERHNSVVGITDEVWHIGDFCWLKADHHSFYETTLEKLNGTHHLILGNHDYCKPFYYVETGFTSVHTANIIQINEHKVVMAHDPAVWNAIPDKNVIFICGHIHLMFKALPKQKIVNVGVDAWNYTPVQFEQVLELLETNKDVEKVSI